MSVSPNQNSNTEPTFNNVGSLGDTEGQIIPSPVTTYYDEEKTKLKSVRPYDNGVDGPMTGQAIDYDENGNKRVIAVFNHSIIPSEVYRFDPKHKLERAAFFDGMTKTREEEYLNGGDEKLVHTYGAPTALKKYFENLFPDATKIIFDTVTTHKRIILPRTNEDYSLDLGEYQEYEKDYQIVTLYHGKVPFAEYVFDYRRILTRATFFDEKGKPTKEEKYSKHCGEKNVTLFNNYEGFENIAPITIDLDERFIVNMEVKYKLIGVTEEEQEESTKKTKRNQQYFINYEGFELKEGTMYVRDAQSNRMVYEASFSGTSVTMCGPQRIWWPNSSQLKIETIFQGDYEPVAKKEWNIDGVQIADLIYIYPRKKQPYEIPKGEPNGWVKKYDPGRGVYTTHTIGKGLPPATTDENTPVKTPDVKAPDVKAPDVKSSKFGPVYIEPVTTQLGKTDQLEEDTDENSEVPPDLARNTKISERDARKLRKKIKKRIAKDKDKGSDTDKDGDTYVPYLGLERGTTKHKGEKRHRSPIDIYEVKSRTKGDDT